MYGIPGQNERSLNTTLRAIEAYDPSHVSLYPFLGRAEITDSAEHQKAHTPDTCSESLRRQAVTYLTGLGYQQYSVYHFARAGRESKYFHLRYAGLDYFGLGLGARSLIDGIFWSNTNHLETYLAHSANFEQVVVDVLSLTPEQHQEYLTSSRALLL